MTKEKLVLIGAGGHCKSVIEAVEDSGLFSIVGIVGEPGQLNESVLGYKVIALDEDLPRLVKEYRHFFVTIGQIRYSTPRVKIFNILLELGCHLPVIISSKAQVSKYSKLGQGTLVMPFAFVNAGVTIGDNCIINTAAIIEHETCIGSHNHLSTGCVVNGNCIIGNNNFLGTNSTLLNNITVGNHNLIGASSVVVKNVGDHLKLFGNPATIIGTSNE
ncbi:MAG TPA: acetyltransferase [Bacteroidales bacterium]|nr:MAG: hypothetical protein A2X11_00680 [Bacteroidetes bacterium GWE2_42_24]OFY27517.1 MAG: hypothetical protein A2X09_07545 [Bacteroidetes bacterium GWF2_43_11]HAQ65003.1 acetyltransferase [Bacteroidales bacterium]HBZ66040.1 acetyltransferase [Bacteroidales bacterium]